MLATEIRGAPPVIVARSKVVKRLNLLMVAAYVILRGTDIEVIRMHFVPFEEINIDLGADVECVQMGHAICFCNQKGSLFSTRVLLAAVALACATYNNVLDHIVVVGEPFVLTVPFFGRSLPVLLLVILF